MNFKTLFGNKNKANALVENNNVDDIMASIQESACAIAEQNVLYAGTSELGGYYFLQTIVVGSFKIKTFKGATLTVQKGNREIVLKTEMDEFESNPMNVSKRYVTKIDFQLEKGDAKLLQSKAIKKLILKAKKHHLEFSPIRH
ncbi:MAG: hypothetical protein HRT67_00485 [Flavobacteriaceae bacterium]|nr:hypothetical protein [Flavobacteriaceae bacterium]